MRFSLILEYSDKKSLQDFIESHSFPIPEKHVLMIFTQILLALSFVHSNNIIHRDIKPSNIYLLKRCVVKLGDFRISKKLQNNLAQTLIGTPFYMSPELLLGKGYSFPSDIWATGCILYELLTGKHCFNGKTQKDLFQNIIKCNIPEIPTGYSDGLISLLNDMLNRNPEKRPTCQQILEYDVIIKGLEVLQSHFTKRKSFQKRK